MALAPCFILVSVSPTEQFCCDFGEGAPLIVTPGLVAYNTITS